MHRRSKGTFAEGEPRSGVQAGARRRRWPHVTRRRTMLFFREFSCDFRDPSRCRDPKGETLRLRSAKVGAPTSSPIKANLKANCDDLQAEPQAQRFSRVSDSATRWVFVCRPKARWSESPLNTWKSQKISRCPLAHFQKIGYYSLISCGCCVRNGRADNSLTKKKDQKKWLPRRLLRRSRSRRPR